MLLSLSFYECSIGALLVGLFLQSMCFFKARKARNEEQERVAELKAIGARAVAVAEGKALPSAPGRRPLPPAAAVLPPGGDALRAPLLQSIQEDEPEEVDAPLPVQTLDELPACVLAFLARAVRDGRHFRTITLLQLGRMRVDMRGGWKEVQAVQRACPLEPAFVWTATASLAPLVSLRGCDSFLGGSGHCTWALWGALPAASGGGREVEQSLLVRWLADAACFPQGLQPSSFLRWDAVPGEPNEATAVLSYAGMSVRGTFTFDRFGRVARLRSADFLRRLPSGRFEAGEWVVSYAGHMLFGLSPQGDVMTEEMPTHAGIFIPTSLEAAWRMPDGSLVHYASFTVAKVTAE